MLRSAGLLSELSDGDLGALEKQCRWQNVAAGKLIIGQHDTSRDVMFLMSGLARVNQYSAAGKQVSFRDIRPGAVFGELSAIDGRPRSADVEALEDSLLLIMPQRAFHEALHAYPPFLKATLRHLSSMVRDLTDRVFEFSTLAVRNRVRAELLRLGRLSSARGKAVLSPAPTHTEMANRISTHREAVTRELNRLEELGLIERHGRTLHIKDVEELSKLIEDLDD